MGKGKNKKIASQGQAQGAPGNGTAGGGGAGGGPYSSAPDPSLAVVALHPQGDAIAVALGSCLRVFDCRYASLVCAALFLHPWALCPLKWCAVPCAAASVLLSTNVTHDVSFI